MGNWLVVPKGTSPARRTRERRAAQYVRMSRELQRYSIKNQMAAIAAYAEANSLTIVRTYRDEGRSGLRIKGRPGLIELIEHVQSGQADFDHILVYDVSRWGRFQDVDESAYYEFLCKRSGVQVEYCAELFKNDGTFVSGIAKSLKRGMAAEWSRELSVKVHAGHCRVASLGYRVGAPVGYGLRRLMVDEGEHPKGFLEKGQFKALQSDRVRLQPGSVEEAAVVRIISVRQRPEILQRHPAPTERCRHRQSQRSAVDRRHDPDHPRERELHRQDRLQPYLATLRAEAGQKPGSRLGPGRCGDRAYRGPQYLR